MWTFIALFIFLTAGCAAVTYNNEEGGILHFTCPDNHVASRIVSAHANGDRLWKIICRPFADLQCSWSPFYHLHQQELNFNCPNNHVVNGVFSFYDVANEDREWSFHCCTVKNLITFECRETPKVHYWSEDFEWQVPGDNFLTGLRTHSRNDDGDHRWSFNYCRARTIDTQIVNSQILTANSPIRNLFAEGDVVVKNGRNAQSCGNCRWLVLKDQVQVPYTVSGDFTHSEKTAIRSAMDDFHLSTCVRFVPHKSQTDYIRIVKKTGCWSLVGRTGGLQELSLGEGCVHHAIIQHELIHALGFLHEQSRTDRDIYVKINYENIQDGLEVNFNRLETNNLNVPYDLSSVMHYGPKDFSKNGKDTITPVSSTGEIGQRLHMSSKDILKINKLYNCKNYLHKHGQWDNVLGETLSRECPSGQAVSGITSSHNSEKKDRLWGISCKAFEVTKRCRWSDEVNQYWEGMDFRCRDKEVIAGVFSTFSTVLQDRRWKFYCCASSLNLFNCTDGPTVNHWHEYFSWPVADSNFLTGVKSSFSGEARDRRWRFSYCQRQTK